MLRISTGENRGPAGVCPKRILIILGPGHQIVAACQADAAAFVQPVPSPVAESITIQLQHRHGVGKLVAFPLLSVGKHVARRSEFQIRHGIRLLPRTTATASIKRVTTIRKPRLRMGLNMFAPHRQLTASFLFHWFTSLVHFTSLLHFWFAIAVLIVFHNEPAAGSYRNHIDGKLPIKTSANPVRDTGMNGVMALHQILNLRVRSSFVRPAKFRNAQLGVGKHRR